MLADRAVIEPARPLPLSRRWLTDHRRSTVAWALSLFGIVVMQLSVYPTVKSQPGMTDLWEKLPEAMKAMFGMTSELDVASGPGYLRAEIFGFTMPLLFLVFGIGAGAAVIAGDEEKGTLGLVLAQPVRRARVVIERFVAVLGDIVVLAAAVIGSIVVVGSLVGLHVGVLVVVGAVAATMLLGTLFGAVALAVGAATGHRGTALAVSAGIAVAAYLIETLANITDALVPLRFLSPFHWAPPTELIAGNSAVGLVWLGLVTAVLVAVAAWAFDRRDLG